MTIITLKSDLTKIAWGALVLMLVAALLGCLRAWWKDLAELEEIGKRSSVRNRFIRRP